MSPYRYEPLDPKAATTRLMTLLPGSFEEETCNFLQTTVLAPEKLCLELRSTIVHLRLRENPSRHSRGGP